MSPRREDTIDKAAKYLLSCAVVSGWKLAKVREHLENVGLKLDEENPPSSLDIKPTKPRATYHANYSLAWYFNHLLKADLEYEGDEIQFENEVYSKGKINILREFLSVAATQDYTDSTDKSVALRQDNALLSALNDIDEKNLLSRSETIAREILENQREWFGKVELNESQRLAIGKSMVYPASFVQGPPGTGKTMMIVRMISYAVAHGQTVAVVSSNNSAVENIVEKFNEISSTDDGFGTMLISAADKVAPLGSGPKRANFNETISDNNKYFDKPLTRDECIDKGLVISEQSLNERLDTNFRAGWERNQCFSSFTKQFPVIACTIHSLKKCFKDGELSHNKYDLVIMDEGSQCNLLLGTIAMSCAKRMVIVGDEEQLPPIIGDALSWTSNWADRKSITQNTFTQFSEFSNKLLNPTRANDSFLSIMQKVFIEHLGYREAKTFLNEHYRCHPGIIKFCNDFVYGGKLQIKTNRDDLHTKNVDLPISVTYYNGDYRESWYPDNHENKASVEPKASAQNLRQIEILREEFGNKIRQDVAKGKTVCLLTPFRGQRNELEKFLNELLNESDAEVRKHDVDSEYEADKNSNRDYHVAPAGSVTVHRPHSVSTTDNSVHGTSTIYRSQGREFDIVYLLPVEDGLWEWPWSQGKRLVNVAVSRAKEELHIIVSTKMMDPYVQTQLIGCAVPLKRDFQNSSNGKRSNKYDNEELYVQKLVRYVFDSYCAATNQVEGNVCRFGIHPAKSSSIFDDEPWWQALSADYSGKKGKISSAEFALLKHLSNMATIEPFFRFYFQVRLKDILPLKDVFNAGNEYLKDEERKFIEDAHEFIDNDASFDFVIADLLTNEIKLAIEVDGEYHRTNFTNKNRDNLKDKIVQRFGGPVIRAGNISANDIDLIQNTNFGLLRIPTDGTSKWETSEPPVTANGELSISTSNFTIEDVIRSSITNSFEFHTSFRPFFQSSTEIPPSIKDTIDRAIKFSPGGNDLMNYTQFFAEWQSLSSAEKIAANKFASGRLAPRSDILTKLRDDKLLQIATLPNPDSTNKRISIVEDFAPTEEGIEKGFRLVCKRNKKNEYFYNIEFNGSARRYLRDYVCKPTLPTTRPKW
ncbi:AAA domain-containing protein [Corynebacterium amycolatum]|uniref:AAA domain-containing protein n=1 Tax=Corynebacterium amycolatum TaxID=43765 RepID=UPI000C770727|nr:AAA domain-containing protein [Corynebacterium amycolatum]PLA35982.1 hypothetical protein CYJ42_04360 [Corynebacterium amycolatum]